MCTDAFRGCTFSMWIVEDCSYWLLSEIKRNKSSLKKFSVSAVAIRPDLASLEFLLDPQKYFFSSFKFVFKVFLKKNCLRPVSYAAVSLL